MNNEGNRETLQRRLEQALAADVGVVGVARRGDRRVSDGRPPMRLLLRPFPQRRLEVWKLENYQSATRSASSR